MNIEIVMLVATLALPDGPPTRVVSAEWPYFRTLAECQNAAQSMKQIPQIVDTVICERRLFDPATGRVTGPALNSPREAPQPGNGAPQPPPGPNRPMPPPGPSGRGIPGLGTQR